MTAVLNYALEYSVRRRASSYTILQTVKLHDVDPGAYLLATVEAGERGENAPALMASRLRLRGEARGDGARRAPRSNAHGVSSSGTDLDAMSEDDDGDDDWDFYPCVVDGRPASILLNLRYEHGLPSSSSDTLYWLRIQMLDPADNGMGSSPEAEVLYPLEDAFIGAATKLGLVYVGRLRNDGEWQLTFYGAAAHGDAFSGLARDANLGGRRFETGSKPDRDWTYYRDFLMPDAERRQWMQDRQVVESLEEHGDVHSTARRVDHSAYFPTPESRQLFVLDVMREGFALEDTSDDAQAFGAHVFRTDTVELEHIHEVVMKLVELAEEHGGFYDGWGSSVEKPPPN